MQALAFDFVEQNKLHLSSMNDSLVVLKISITNITLLPGTYSWSNFNNASALRCLKIK